MLNKIKFFVEPHKAANTDSSQPILVALSGGADSSCLLHILSEYSKNTGCKLYAAHVNHNIRTDAYSGEANRDEQFCRELCLGLNVELFVKNADVPLLAKQTGKSLETAARDIRYEFFADIMRQKNIKILATAHNADDNLETLIFNLCRGCGVDGICGIPRKRGFDAVDGAVIVRPILDATKAEIETFCRAENIPFVTDSTNFEDDCTRNRIRHNIIPELVALFGSPQRSALRLSKSAEQSSALIRTQAESFLQDSGGIDITRFNELPEAVAVGVLSAAFHERFDAYLEAVHIDSVIGLAKNAKEGASVSLPCSARAVIKNKLLVFCADTKQPHGEKYDYDISLNEGINILGDTDFAVAVESCDKSGSTQISDQFKLYSSAVLYLDDITSLKAKNRREGDNILGGGMHKKLKKLMCDKKVDIYDRELLPIIHCNGEIIYVPLCAVADNAKKHRDKKAINITIYKKPYKRIH